MLVNTTTNVLTDDESDAPNNILHLPTQNNVFSSFLSPSVPAHNIIS